MLETHLFGFSGDLYDQTAEVTPLQKLRDERKFSSLDDLKAQIEIDAAQARAMLAGGIN